MNENVDIAEELLFGGNGEPDADGGGERGPVIKNGRIVIGRVGAPPQHEATSGKFYFWVPKSVVVERTQLVTCESKMAGLTFTFYGLVDEVRRRSRHRDMAGEVDEADGDLNYDPLFQTDGYTFAEVSVLRTEPAVFTPPIERSDVFLANPEEAQKSYDADRVKRPLRVGLIKNGGDKLAGPGVIDLDYLLGVNGGHMNVTGTAGRGTKSSFVLTIIHALLQEAHRQRMERPSDSGRLRIVPIILNVKNFDLFYIDHINREYDPNRHADDWHELGFDEPMPFENVRFFAAQQPSSSLPVATGRPNGVEPYSWSLRDVIEGGLFSYLFSEADVVDDNFSALILDIENWLTDEKIENDGSVTRRLRNESGRPKTFEELKGWISDQTSSKDDGRVLNSHHTATWRKLHRRLIKLLYEGRGVLRYSDQNGSPLNVTRTDITDPMVVDLAALAGQPALQRFVVATIFRQLMDARTGTNAISGLVYLVMLDELNRFAPRGARDPITQLVETVAAEMRSQGIILMGAQQQASKVSEKVIENAAIRVLGQSGWLELGSSTWRFLSDSARKKALSLPLNEKLIIQDNFREPMHVRVPFPIWAMNPNEAEVSASPRDDDFDASKMIDD